MTTAEFGSFFKLIRNGMNVKQDKSGDGLPVTRIETIAEAAVDPTRVGYAGLDEAQCRDFMMENGDILFSHINSVEHVGKCAVYRGSPSKLVHGMNLLCLRCDSNRLLPEFAKYVIRGPQFRARLSNFINKAVNQASVSIGNLKTIPVTLPPLEEQRRIADVLDRAEALRAKRRAALAQLDTLTQSIFLEMFGDPGTNPRGWQRTKLRDAVFSASDGPHVSPTYSDNGIPFISTRHVRAGEITWEDLKFISPEDAEIHWRKCRPEFGDILYTKGGTTGLAVAVTTRQPFALWVHVALLKPNPLKVDSIWLESMLNTEFCYRQSQELTHGIANRDLGLTRMVNIDMFLPPLTLQREFGRGVDYVKKLRAAQKASLAQIEVLFASLQNKAFRGELL